MYTYKRTYFAYKIVSSKKVINYKANDKPVLTAVHF